MTHSLVESKSKHHMQRSGNGHGTARKAAIQAIQSRENMGATVDHTRLPVAEIYGSNVFNVNTMRQLLPKNVYKAVMRCLDFGERLDPAMADIVANAMKDWAVSRGATHFTHWFHPMTGLTAEKHDSFLVPTEDDKALAEF